MPERKSEVSIVLPTLNAGPALTKLLTSLRAQSLPVADIQIVDSESEDGTVETAKSWGCTVTTIPRATFDHGGARNLAVANASGNILVFLTQDALPVSHEFLSLLTAPIDGRVTAASYARQLATPDAPPTEIFTRLYNYPAESERRRISHFSRRTPRTFFFSDAASAIDRDCFEKVGRFPAPVRAIEDMLICARLLDAGYQIAYVAEAEVTHSHDLSLAKLFRRYYDFGVVAKEYRDAFRFSASSGDGLKFAQSLVQYLRRTGSHCLIPRAIAETGVKAMAYYFGQISGSYSTNRAGLQRIASDSAAD